MKTHDPLIGIFFQNLVLCFRLHFTKDSTTINTAGATVRQLVSLVFERVVVEDEEFAGRTESEEVNLEELKIPTNQAPKGLRPCAADAYLMFQVANLSVVIFLSFHGQEILILSTLRCFRTWCNW